MFNDEECSICEFLLKYSSVSTVQFFYVLNGYSERYFNDGINTDVLSKEITCYNKIQSDMFCGHIKSR